MLRTLYPAPAAPHASVMREDLVALATAPVLAACPSAHPALPAFLLAAHFSPLVLN